MLRSALQAAVLVLVAWAHAASASESLLDLIHSCSQSQTSQEFAWLSGFSRCKDDHPELHPWPLHVHHPRPCSYVLHRLARERDAPRAVPPPNPVPQDLRAAYTLCEAIHVSPWFQVNIYNGAKDRVLVWNSSLIEGFMALARNRSGFTYGPEQRSFYPAFQRFPVAGRGVVFGTEQPWAEALGLASGASHMTTIEYSAIRSEDPRVSAIHPYDLAERFDRGSLEPFDFGISYSSFEHSGLGRYGDVIDPFGDLKALEVAGCVIKPGGLLYLAVPTGKDLLYWNAHRIYGALRLPLVTAGWEPVGWFTPEGGRDLGEIRRELHRLRMKAEQDTQLGSLGQPLIVLRNRRDSGCPPAAAAPLS